MLKTALAHCFPVVNPLSPGLLLHIFTLLSAFLSLPPLPFLHDLWLSLFNLILSARDAPLTPSAPNWTHPQHVFVQNVGLSSLCLLHICLYEVKTCLNESVNKDTHVCAHTHTHRSRSLIYASYNHYTSWTSKLARRERIYCPLWLLRPTVVSTSCQKLCFGQKPAGEPGSCTLRVELLERELASLCLRLIGATLKCVIILGVDMSLVWEEQQNWGEIAD